MSELHPLQCLPQQPLTRPDGERLVLHSLSTCQPVTASGRLVSWVNNIASKNAHEFLQAINPLNRFIERWRWPAVVLIPEEYNLRVGGMSVTELRQQLENYWGRGGIIGTTFVRFWDMILLYYGERVIFDYETVSHWVNRECDQWLDYFISENHTLGAVHAWFTAFIGVTRESLPSLVKSFRDSAYMESIHRIKFRMSFDVCMGGHDEVVDGLPSLPSNAVITTNAQGMQVIHNSINKMYPQRIWDICANMVIPATWFCGPPCPLTGRQNVGVLGVKPVSHAWVADEDLNFVLTEANQQMWPIPLPKGVLLEDVRREMIRLGVRYAWLDVLCLRQCAQPTLATDSAIPVSTKVGAPSTEIAKSRERRRLKEWKVDLPTIGAIYSNLDEAGLYGGGLVVIFMSGFGRPFRDEGWNSERHWLNRAWSLPLMSLIAG